MAEIATINGISPSAISTINGVSISAIGTINGCTPGEGVPDTGIFLTIDSDLVDADLVDMPVGVVLDSSIAMLAGLSSTDWRYLHATSGGYELFVEVDVWDMTTPLAVLWIRCPSLLSSSDIIVKLEITSERNDTLTFSSPFVWDNFNGDDGDEANTGLWAVIEDGTPFDIQSNRITATHSSAQIASLRSKAVLMGDFDIEIDFDITSAPSTATWAFQFQVTTSDAFSNDLILIDRRYNGTHRYYSTILISGNDYHGDVTTTDTLGKFRIVRSGSVATVYYYSDGWVAIDSESGFTTDDVYIMLRSVTSTTMSFQGSFENLTINSCDGITGFIGETGDHAAHVVWDSDFVGVYHLSQIPEVTLYTPDSTVNDLPGLNLSTHAVVDEGFGRSFDFNLAASTTTSGINLGVHAEFQLQEFSILGYHKPDSGSGWDLVLLTRINAAASIYNSHILYNNNGNYRFGVMDVDSVSTTPATTDWVVTAGSYDGSYRRLYVNGTKEDETAQTDTITYSGLPTHIADYGQGQEYDGMISEIQFHKVARSDAWIKVMSNNLLGNLVTISEVQPTIKYATIDNTLIDSTLTNFPIGIQITATDGLVNGLGTTDYEGFHFTVGGVECYAEVDVWEPNNGSAVFWVRVPSVSSSADTVVKIQNVEDDNTAYVGITGSTPAQTVWDSDFVGVWHMSQDPSTSDLLDSTSYGNDGTPNGSMTSGDSVYSGFGKAIEFDGNNDYFVVADSNELDLGATTSMTMESFANSYSASAQHDMMDKRTTDQGYLLGVNSSNLIDYYAKDNPYTAYIIATTTVTRDGTTFYHYAGTMNRSDTTMRGYLNGVEDATSVSISDLDDCSNSSALYIGYRNPSLSMSSWTYFYGAISEVRISNTARSAAWIKATAQNLLGNLVTIS